MPFKDSEARRKYHRERQRVMRASPVFRAKAALNARKKYWAKRGRAAGYSGAPKGVRKGVRKDMNDRLCVAESVAGWSLPESDPTELWGEYD